MNSTTIVGIVIVLLILGFSFVLCSNAYPNIRVYDKGLKVQVLSLNCLDEQGQEEGIKFRHYVNHLRTKLEPEKKGVQ